jgi:hypothetical protein
VCPQERIGTQSLSLILSIPLWARTRPSVRRARHHPLPLPPLYCRSPFEYLQRFGFQRRPACGVGVDTCFIDFLLDCACTPTCISPTQKGAEKNITLNIIHHSQRHPSLSSMRRAICLVLPTHQDVTHARQRGPPTAPSTMPRWTLTATKSFISGSLQRN